MNIGLMVIGAAIANIDIVIKLTINVMTTTDAAIRSPLIVCNSKFEKRKA